MDLTVVTMPSMDDAHTGYVYMNQIDSEYVGIGDYIYRCLPHFHVHPGTIALNAVQRRLAKVSNGKQLFVDTYIDSKVPNIEFMNVELSWLIRDAEHSIPHLANTFRSHYTKHILTDGQQVVLHVKDNLIMCTVRLPLHRGFVTMQTHVMIHWQH
jgi:vesicle-fusing ATPase